MVYPKNDNDDSEFECNICSESFTESGDKVPHIFPVCGHSNCKACIDLLITDAKKKDLEFVSCPTCRKETAISSEFPKNFMFVRKLEQESIQINSSLASV